MISRLDPAALAADPALLTGLVALNNAHAAELSWLEPADFVALVGEAWFAADVPPADALLIALAEGADYASPNYRWFGERFDRFVYIDRVVVADSARGRGLARQLYAGLIAAARAGGHARVVCEINRDPPNPASWAFHAAQGFRAIGEQRLPGGKVVGYCALDLGD